MNQNTIEKCNLSSVQTGIVVLSQGNQIEHHGALTHICSLEKGHYKPEKGAIEYCKCTCGHQWRKFHTES